VIEFVEECRREWRRLGVPDPIANEMAADLTADIEEAEAEGGSAEDVLGNSVFDPRTFAASWAGARGVTAPPLGAPELRGPAPGAPALVDGPVRHRAVLAVALTAFAVFFVLAAIALLIGRHSASAAVSVRRIMPRPVHLFGPGPLSPSLRLSMFGSQFSGPHNGLFVLFAVLMLLFALAALGLAFVYWSPWSRRKHQAMARVTGRTKWSGRPSR